jgi:hypothetical protein
MYEPMNGIVKKKVDKYSVKVDNTSMWKKGINHAEG